MADDIKYRGGGYQSNWHFVDTPFIDTPGKTIADYPDFKPDSYNVTHTLEDIIAWQRHETGY